jgi:hypothetical protein
MKILIIVLSHKDNGIYSDFYESQKKTWDSINVEGVETYYLFGNHNCDEIVGNEILVDVVENNFNNCGHKTLKSFILTKDVEYDYIFRTNSSSYVDKNLLLEYIKDKPLENYYSGVIGNHNGIKFSSGCGYFISRNLVQLLIDNSDRWNHNHIDDVLVGELLCWLGHNPTSNPRFDVGYNTNIPTNYFHYRLKTDNRINDIKNMYKIHQLKNYDN